MEDGSRILHNLYTIHPPGTAFRSLLLRGTAILILRLCSLRFSLASPILLYFFSLDWLFLFIWCLWPPKLFFIHGSCLWPFQIFFIISFSSDYVKFIESNMRAVPPSIFYIPSTFFYIFHLSSHVPSPRINWCFLFPFLYFFNLSKILNSFWQTPRPIPPSIWVKWLIVDELNIYVLQHPLFFITLNSHVEEPNQNKWLCSNQ